MNDYGEYNGDNVHDMWVDYTYQENTDELTDWFEDGYDDNGSSYGGGVYHRPSYTQSQPPKSTSQLISECKSRLASYKSKIANVEAEIERTKESLENTVYSPKKKARLERLLAITYPNQLARIHKSIESDETELASLLIRREKERNFRTIGICIFTILVSLFIFCMIYN